MTYEDNKSIKTYYVGKNGAIVKNTFVNLKDGSKIFLNKKGEMVINKIITFKGKKYFLRKDGRLVTGKQITIKGKKYDSTKTGVLKKVK